MSAPEPPSPLDLLRDPRAAVDTGLGPLAFVIANAVAGLHTAAAVAVGISILGLASWSSLWIYLVAEFLAAAVAALTFKALNPADK